MRKLVTGLVALIAVLVIAATGTTAAAGCETGPGGTGGDCPYSGPIEGK